MIIKVASATEVFVRLVPIAVTRSVVGWLAWPLAPLLVACGSRTGLLLPAERDGTGSVSADGAADVPLPATTFLGDCFGSAPPPIYVFTQALVPRLIAFDPSTAAFTALPPTACPDGLGSPLGLAVDRSANIYLLVMGTTTGMPSLLRIVLGTGRCTALPLAAPPLAPPSGGLTFAEDDDGKGETLYFVTRDSQQSPPAAWLSAVDPGFVATRTVGRLAPPTRDGAPLLTGTAGGEIFALYPNQTPPVLARVDPQSGQATTHWTLSGVRGVLSGFAFWGGDFYLFQWVGVTEVLRFRPRDRSLVALARLNEPVGGATSSTCSPLR
jgi:hypothetical protein